MTEQEKRKRNREYLRKYRAGVSGYTPIDAIIASPAVRVMRALRWFDWATASDVYLALDLPDYADNPQPRDAHHSAISHMVKAGRIEADRAARPYRYRITPAGREWLRAALSVPGLENAATGKPGPENEKGAA